MDENERIARALRIASQYGQIDGAHHKMWVIDQMVRSLLGADMAYEKWILEYEGDEEYYWDEGIAP